MSGTFRDFEHAGWSDGAVAKAYDERLSSLTTQSSAALLDAVDLVRGARLLDVATGAGYVAALAAQREAQVTGIDFSAEQIALARRRNPTLAFEQCDAEQLPFADGSFDAVVSGFGVPHLSHPDRFFAEAFRVLRGGGRIAFTVWEAPQKAKVYEALFAAVKAHGVTDVGLPKGPEPFLFADPAVAQAGLATAGFAHCHAHTVPQTMLVRTADEAFDAFWNGSVRMAGLLRGQAPAALAAIRDSVRASLEQFRRGESLHIPMPAVLSCATKP